MKKDKAQPLEVIDLTDEVSSSTSLDRSLTARVLSMFEQGHTVPFIARYRKEVTGGLPPSVLHKLHEKMLESKSLIEQIDKAHQDISKKGFMTQDLARNLKLCKSLDELKLMIKPFKSDKPHSLAAKARAADLEPLACELLNGGSPINLFARAPRKAIELYKTKGAIEQAIRDIIADIFAKDLDVVRYADHLCTVHPPTLQTTEKKSTQKQCSKDKKATGKAKNVPVKKEEATNSASAGVHTPCKDDHVTFKNYLNFSRLISHLQAHQILAINRAADRDVLSIKIIIPPPVFSLSRQYVLSKYLPSVHPTHHHMVETAFSDSWNRLIEPHLVRSVRSKLLSSAQDTSLSVFSENLRRLLMTAPLRASQDDPLCNPNISEAGVISSSTAPPGDRLPVLGLDPGWRHGCKWAACDPHGAVLATGVVWPPILSEKSSTWINRSLSDNGLSALTAAMQRHNIHTIALGNGQASRQTGRWLAHLITIGHFHPLSVRFAVVSEAGASWYSASELADRELPKIDVSLRGAVSIARRLQDPLAELVKIEPKHLGVGMYQHDLPEKRLIASVNAVMEECISFVGVDLNAAPLHILSRVAGLTEAKAKAIIDHRSKNGLFRSRAELNKVKGIGPNTFAQCAGFIRIRPTFPINSEPNLDDTIVISSDDDSFSSCSKKPGRGKRRKSAPQRPPAKKPRITPSPFNPLDQTAVHPDSYGVASRLISSLGFKIADVGSVNLRDAAASLLKSDDRDTRLAKFCTEEFGLDTVRDIVEALSRPVDFDERQDSFLPLFHSSAMSLSDLKVGMSVSGRIENVTTFGAFCDIGVQQDAYIPRQAYPEQKTSDGMFSLQLGDRVCAVVSQIDVKLGRISLSQVSVIPPVTVL